MSALSRRLYAVQRMATLVARRPGSFLLSVVLCAAALAVPLFLVALAHSAAPWKPRLSAGPELSVFVAIGTLARDVEAMKAKLAAFESVAEVRLIPRDEAFNEISKRAGLPSSATEARANPLPDVLAVRFATVVEPALVERAAASIRRWPAVDTVRVDLEWYRRIAAVARAALSVLAVVGGLTLILVVLVLAAAVRSQAAARREETDVLQMVGAQTSFIVRPYAYAGGLTLGLGAALSVALVAAGIALIGPSLAALAVAYGQTFHWARVPLWFPAGFVVIAGLVGVATGWVATRFAIADNDM
jgi:cell division transport system permease protein